MTNEPANLIRLTSCSNAGYYCSKCHKKIVKDGWSDTVKRINYCPNCGEKLEVNKTTTPGFSYIDFRGELYADGTLYLTTDAANDINRVIIMDGGIFCKVFYQEVE